MSLIKVMKGWRAVLKLTLLRKGPRLPPKTHVPKAKETKLELEGYSQQQRNYAPRFNSAFLKSIFSRHAGLIRRHTLSYLRPRYAGVNRLRNVPIFSLVGLSLGLDTDLLSDNYLESVCSICKNVFKDYKWEPDKLETKPKCLDDLEINKTSVIGNGCEGAVFEAKLKDGDAFNDTNLHGTETSEKDYNLAVKAVFNYGAESNASSIMRELKREIVPLQPSDCEPSQFEDIINTNILRLPPHPNIVDMHSVFVDDMLVTEQGRREFPAAMPRRVDPDGCFGRNKTLYLVMRKCATRLSDFQFQEVSMTTRCLLLTQLLEAVHHMNSYGVAHRDIKADNVLIDTPITGTPYLQVCDFGCCLAEDSKKLVLPFVSNDVNIGGNSWLMAPEIACARPGEGSVLDFRASDLWACGALAYQILGADNPFYPNSSQQLKTRTYTEDELPLLSDNVPAPIKRLVKSMLARDPAKRPSASVAVLVVHMVLWESHSTNATRVSGRNPSSVPSSINRKRHHKVGMSKGNTKTSSYVRFANKRRQKMGLVLAQMFGLIRKMTTMASGETSSSSSLVKQDVVEISNFLCLSRLTQADFDMALKYFH